MDSNFTTERDFKTENLHQYVHVKGSTGYVTILFINFDREQPVSFDQYNGERFDNVMTWVAEAEDDQGKTQ